MKIIARFLAIAFACFAFGQIASAQTTSNTSLALCKNIKYALCAASTCTRTGKTIAVNTPEGGKRNFPEAVCTCPVLNSGSEGAIANLNGGNMTGSCDSPPGTVWSLYSTANNFPQATTGWQASPAKLNKSCTASLNLGRQFANCFSFKCDRLRLQQVQGGGTTLVADCHCPVGEDVFSALPTKPNTGFFTEAGGATANPQSFCYQTPVGGF